MMENSPNRRQDGVRKRVSNACYRCRQQKIRCSGRMPCEQCTKRNLRCSFEDKSQKILVSREFINDLERRAADASRNADETSIEHGHYNDTYPRGGANNPAGPAGHVASSHVAGHVDAIDVIESLEHENTEQNELHCNARDAVPHVTFDHGRSASDSGRATPSAQLTNPFSTHTPRYVTDSSGRRYYLGTSSNWAFNLQVLNMAHEKLMGGPVPAQNTSFDGTMYDLGWDGQREYLTPDNIMLPSADYAIYLINAVKFHCGQMFHLFDEETFMCDFSKFHATSAGNSSPKGLWYIHFLLILAFGKVFVARRNDGKRPPGSELFVRAMKLMPDIIYLHTQPPQAIEVLCCQALYLQCLDFRSAAYNVIGQALRMALEAGMHTNMQDQGLDDAYVQRCRNVWWTVYILDRQMSSLMGVPLALRDEDISASLPTITGSPQKAVALQMNVRLSGTISQILNTVYGTEGRLNRKFISSTKKALTAIAGVADQLNKSFDFPPAGSTAGISRLSAHLHLLQHQCIVLATRPLLFSLLKKRLEKYDDAMTLVTSSGSTRTLLQMCVESSQHIIAVLERLREQHLLECFLPSDLEAACAATMVLLIAPIVNRVLLKTQFPWLDMAYVVLDELILQGHKQAAIRKSELFQVQQLFNQFPTHLERGTGVETSRRQSDPEPSQITDSHAAILHPDSIADPHTFDFEFIEDALWRTAFTSDQLMNVADTLDLDGVEWMTTGSSTMAE